MKRQQRFRASIYIDVMIDIPKTLENECFIDQLDKTLEEMREEASQRSSKSLLKRYEDPEQREQNRQSQLKNYREHPERKEKLRQSHLGSHRSEKTKLLMSQNHADISGKKNPNYGKPTYHSKKIFSHLTPLQGERKMHRWEHLLAEYYDSINEPYFYEPGRLEMVINGKETTYTPDFSLPLKLEFVEVKGWWRDDAKAKSDKFKEELDDEEIKGIFGYKILFSKDLKELDVI